jgi:hypothetical protein
MPANPQDFEKLGVFYLGRPYDIARREARPGVVLYDSRDLVTHAVCVGMTGSGKTGLCIGLLEEAAMDGIPAIAIDPKGDLSNLLLTFPELRPEDFLPWVQDEEARRKGVTTEALAASQAEAWRKGLAEWGQDGDRIRRLKENADFAIYTPGSTAGLPVSILKSFAAPGDAILDDRELLAERVSSTASSLLALVGIDADPVSSRDHILIANILSAAWRKVQDLDLAALIGQIQTPPFQRVGVLEVDSFYPAKDRFALAMKVNNLLASPGFESWLEGEALDPAALLYSPSGKPRISVFSIAHLSDAERMFFVSLLLNQVLGWVRSQPGTTSLRALLYMDEIFGYFPPVANPPSKQPLLTLLKQARAFGVGVVLATQNPVDLDYKGLANAGTWFLGRLQTERDKARVLEGLEGAATAAGSTFDRKSIDEILSGLGKRVFLMNNVHASEPVIFETRWTMSYLSGPLTRAQIRKLAQGARPAPKPAAAPVAAPSKTAAGPDAGSPRPVLPPDITQYFLPAPAGTGLVYSPALLGMAQVSFSDRKLGVEVTRDCSFVTALENAPVPADWDKAELGPESPDALEAEPVEDASFGPLPPPAARARTYTAWQREFTQWLARAQSLDLLRSRSLGLISAPGESERDFRMRLQQKAREQRDEVLREIQTVYQPRLERVEERLRRAMQVQEREAEQARAQSYQTAFSVGATLLGAFLGRSPVSSTTINRAGTAARSWQRQQRETGDVARAGETVEAVQAERDRLEAEMYARLEDAKAKLAPLSEPLETVSVKSKKTGIAVRVFALVWRAG